MIWSARLIIRALRAAARRRHPATRHLRDHDDLVPFYPPPRITALTLNARKVRREDPPCPE